MTGERLSAVDAAWLRMDRPTNRMMITSVAVLRGRVEPAAVERVIRERLLPHPRFRQHVEWSALGRPRWVEDPYFALSSHLHHVALPPPGDDAALRELVGDLMSAPLDRARPLWTTHLVDGYQGDSAIIMRVHHCVADGVALVRLLLSLTDHEAQASAPEAGAPPPPHTGTLGQLGRAVGGARALVHDLLMPADAPTPLQGRLGVRKRAAWTAAHDVTAVVTAAHALGGTLNDLMLAAVAGALRSYVAARTGEIPEVDVRAMVPVNLRRVVGGGEAGNRFGLVYVTLPLTQPTPAERLAVVQRRMDDIKHTPEAVMSFGVLGAMGLASVTIERFGVELFAKKASTMITSVPGPTAPLSFAGRPLASLLVWAPASGQMSVTLSILSYAGRLQVGIASDERVVPDPEVIAAALDRELHALVPNG